MEILMDNLPAIRYIMPSYQQKSYRMNFNIPIDKVLSLDYPRNPVYNTSKNLYKHKKEDFPP